MTGIYRTRSGLPAVQAGKSGTVSGLPAGQAGIVETRGGTFGTLTGFLKNSKALYETRTGQSDTQTGMVDTDCSGQICVIAESLGRGLCVDLYLRFISAWQSNTFLCNNAQPDFMNRESMPVIRLLLMLMRVY